MKTPELNAFMRAFLGGHVEQPSAVTARPMRLEDYGDRLLTDADLCALAGRGAKWASRERAEARRQHRAPNLPAQHPAFKQPRYHRSDVARWLETGTSRRALRRIA